LTRQNLVERDADDRRCCCHASRLEPSTPREVTLYAGAFVKPPAQPLMNSVERGIVGQVGACAGGDEARGRGHGLRFILRRLEAARPAASQEIVNEPGDAVSG
jgi:hypothetical protein